MRTDYQRRLEIVQRSLVSLDIGREPARPVRADQPKKEAPPRTAPRKIVQMYHEELSAYLAPFVGYSVLREHEDFVPLFTRYHGADEADARKARDLLVYGNILLVVKMAFRYSNKGLPLLDLAQEGYFGLQRAIERYDIERGNKFSTYASFWLRSAMQRALEGKTDDQAYHIPVHYLESMKLVRRMCTEFFQLNGRLPRELELYQTIKRLETKVAQKLTLDRIIELLQAIYAGTEVRLDAPAIASTDSSDTVGDRLVFGLPRTDTVVEARRLYVEYSRAIEKIEAAVTELPPRTAQVVSLRLGLGDFEIMTLEEIGQRYEMSRERARQLEVAAFKGSDKFEGLEARLKIGEQEIRNTIEIYHELEGIAHAY